MRQRGPRPAPSAPPNETTKKAVHIRTHTGPIAVGATLPAFAQLAGHVWLVARADDSNDSSATFLQLFQSYTTKTGATFGSNTESAYDWESDAWSVPVNLSVTQLLKVDSQLMTLQAGPRNWADNPDGVGPEGLRLPDRGNPRVSEIILQS
jgi:hypothetical protein